MRLDLNRLSMHFYQKNEEPPLPQEGLNRYLLQKVLAPALHRTDIYLQDIDFNAFDVDDVEALENYYDRLFDTAQGLEQFIQTVTLTPPVAGSARAFC